MTCTVVTGPLSRPRTPVPTGFQSYLLQTNAPFCRHPAPSPARFPQKLCLLQKEGAKITLPPKPPEPASFSAKMAPNAYRSSLPGRGDTPSAGMAPPLQTPPTDHG
ncbi:hypothetical protein PMIN04_009837 [Paraphaeosphaeria minitans]